MGFKPVIWETGVTVDSILELVASGMKPGEIDEDYSLSLNDIQAALLYAALVLGREELIEVGAGTWVTFR